MKLFWMEKVKFKIDEDEVRILNQVNYNADAYHMFTLKKWQFLSKFYNNFETGFQHFENSFSPAWKRR